MDKSLLNAIFAIVFGVVITLIDISFVTAFVVTFMASIILNRFTFVNDWIDEHLNN